MARPAFPPFGPTPRTAAVLAQSAKKAGEKAALDGPPRRIPAPGGGEAWRTSLRLRGRRLPLEGRFEETGHGPRLRIVVRHAWSEGGQAKSTVVGRALFVRTRRGWQAMNVEVREDFRRLGIATALYDAAEEILGEAPVPVDEASVAETPDLVGQTEDGAAFWESWKRRREGEESEEEPAEKERSRAASPLTPGGSTPGPLPVGPLLAALRAGGVRVARAEAWRLPTGERVARVAAAAGEAGTLRRAAQALRASGAFERVELADAAGRAY